LEEKCVAIEEELRRRIDADPRMARKRDVLRSIPGVGLLISALVTRNAGIANIDRKAAASLARL
jgi:transposase